MKKVLLTNSIGFVGGATGSAVGTWYATVNHSPLDPGASITPGGSFGMVLDKARPAHLVTGHFSGGSITANNTGTGCTNQTYTVSGLLAGVPVTGTGTFSVTLTHHRKNLFGACVIYAATVSGTVTLP